jgi:hypothetical protein
MEGNKMNDKLYDTGTRCVSSKDWLQASKNMIVSAYSGTYQAQSAHSSVENIHTKTSKKINHLPIGEHIREAIQTIKDNKD